MFYAIYEQLCTEHGEKPYQLPLKLGAKSNSVVAQWQKGSVPRGAMLQKIADHFGVSVAYLLGETEQKNPSTTSEGSEGIPGYSTLSEENKATVRNLIDFLLSQQQGNQ